MQLNDVASLVKLLDKSSLTEISFSDESSKVVLKKEVFRSRLNCCQTIQIRLTRQPRSDLRLGVEQMDVCGQ